MPRVICDLPNASDLINGVKFELLEDGRRISEEIDEDTAENFASIPGYAFADEEPEQPAPVVTEDAQAKTEQPRRSGGRRRQEKEPTAEADAAAVVTEEPKQETEATDITAGDEVF